jgi:23S rRNA (pseudouridine1915-N3)-methyltransferase
MDNFSLKFRFLMNLKVMWPGKTRNRSLRELQKMYLEKIGRLGRCVLVETKEARGLTEKESEKIMEIEAAGLEMHLEEGYIICLSDKGKEMSSDEFAGFMQEVGSSSNRCVTFIVGGFLGLADRILRKANFLLSLSRMTFSHELTRIVLLEQIYRSLTIIQGRRYAK